MKSLADEEKFGYDGAGNCNNCGSGRECSPECRQDQLKEEILSLVSKLEITEAALKETINWVPDTVLSHSKAITEWRNKC